MKLDKNKKTDKYYKKIFKSVTRDATIIRGRLPKNNYLSYDVDKYFFSFICLPYKDAYF